MINIFLSMLFAVLSFTFFETTYQVNAVNRAFINVPIQLIENSVIIKEYDGTYESIYINQDRLETSFHTYFDENIAKYTDEYSLEFIYMDPETKGVCTSEECRGFKVYLDAKIGLSFNYHKGMYYEVGGYE